MKERQVAKPTRADLMAVIAELQDIILSVSAICGNDRASASERDDLLGPLLRRGFDLCLAARVHDPSNAGERSRFVETELPR